MWNMEQRGKPRSTGAPGSPRPEPDRIVGALSPAAKPFAGMKFTKIRVPSNDFTRKLRALGVPGGAS